MKFQAKIFLAVMTILVATLLLNSVLSLASFEKLYVASLISTYEMVGKNLKRKIEQSLRFGKPLDKFKGMNTILIDTVRKNREISFVAVGQQDGTILYQSKEETSPGRFRYPIPDDIDLAKNHTQLFGNEYVTYIPLLDRTGKTVGVLNLIFSRNVVYRELKSMAREDVTMLSLIVTASALCLFVLLSFLIVHPLRRKLINISESIRWPSEKRISVNPVEERHLSERESAANIITDPARAVRPKTKNEVNRLAMQIKDFINLAENNIEKLTNIKNNRKDLVDSLGSIMEYDTVIGKILTQRDDLSQSDRKALSEISKISKTFCREAFAMLEVSKSSGNHADRANTGTEQS